MKQRESFFHLLKPDHLYAASMFFAVITLLLVSQVYIYLYIKKRRFRIISQINHQINEWIGMIISEKEFPVIDLTKELKLYLKKEKNREFLIDNLIKIRKNLTGSAAQSIVELYKNLQLKDDSIARFKSYAWHKKAKGIYELYMMDQEAELPDIYLYTNSKNEYIRMEAQTAIIGFWGFEGLTFLESLEEPLHEWQQLKLLEQLSTLDIVPLQNLSLWLRSGNEYVKHFALKLTDIYRQLDMHDLVADCLQSANVKIRAQAIKSLGRIADDSTAEILISHYPTETNDNKKKILQQLATIGNNNITSFLEEVLKEDDDFLKLEATRALVAVNNDVKILNKFQADKTMASIARQIQYEQA